MAHTKNNTAIQQASKLLNVALIVPLTEAEAEHLLQSIQGHLTSADAEIIELHDRDGWKALGYTSWKDCVAARLDISRGHGYRLLAAARVRKNVNTLPSGVSPIGDTPPVPNEAQARALAKAPAEAQREVYQAAAQASPSGKPTAKEIAGEILKRQPSIVPKSFPKPARRYEQGQKVQLVTTGLICDVGSVTPEGKLNVKARAGNWRGQVEANEVVPFGEWKPGGQGAPPPSPQPASVSSESLRERAYALIAHAPDDLLQSVVEQLELALEAL